MSRHAPRMTLKVLFAVLAVFGVICPESFGETVSAVFIRDGKEVTPSVSLETAHTKALRSFGLMYRKELAKNSGMLFIYPVELPRTFWMKNTFIALDMIFLDKNLKVQGILEHVPPRSLEPKTIPGIKSQYIIEFAGGVSKTLGIQTGDILHTEDPLPKGDEGI